MRFTATRCFGRVVWRAQQSQGGNSVKDSRVTTIIGEVGIRSWRMLNSARIGIRVFGNSAESHGLVGVSDLCTVDNWLATTERAFTIAFRGIDHS